MTHIAEPIAAAGAAPALRALAQRYLPAHFPGDRRRALAAGAVRVGKGHGKEWVRVERA